MTADPLHEAPATVPADALAAAALGVARHFAAGATMWCTAPRWPSHAEHLAVEFVHPVVVGARALPSVAAVGPDPVARVRASSRPGDLLAVVATGDDHVAAELVSRARAWGLASVWIGAGDPPATRADHMVWLREEPAPALHGGAFVMAYHLLWELTHVCLEHPGIVAPQTGDDEDRCITCSDDACPAEVASVDRTGLATVRTADGPQLVDATLVGTVAPGDLLLVHAGVALARLDADGVTAPAREVPRP